MSTAISRKNGLLVVPDDPIIPFIEGDGTGPDIWRASVRVLDAAVEKAFGGTRTISWKEVYAGEKEFKQIRFGTDAAAREWQAQLEAIGAPHREVGVEVGIGLKPISRLGTERLVYSAIGYAIKFGRKNLTLVHKGNIMKFTEGGFRD